MKKSSLWVMLMICCMALCQAPLSAQKLQMEKPSSRLSGIPKPPVAGTTIEVVYTPKGGPLEGKGDLVALVYMYNFYQWELGDVELKQEGDIWKGKFAIPANCAFMAFKFQSTWSQFAEVSDNNDDKGYLYVVADANNQPLPGGNLAWGLFRKPSAGLGIYNYFSQNFKEIEQDALYFWYQKELRDHQQYADVFFPTMMSIIQKQTGERFPEAAAMFFTIFSQQNPAISEENYATMENLYRFALKDPVKADSIRQLIKKKYPNGWTVRREAFDAVYKSGDKFEESMQAFLTDYPVTDLKKHPEWPAFVYYNAMRNFAVSFFYPGKNVDVLLKMLPDYDFKTLAEVYRSTVGPFHTKKAVADSINYPIAKVLIAEMSKKVNDRSYMKEDLFSPHQSDFLARTLLDEHLGNYADILYCMDKPKEALEQITQISAKKRYATPEVNETHIRCLQQTGLQNRVKSVVEQAFKANAVTPSMMEMLKKEYVAKHDGNKSGFEAYVASLKPQADVEAMRAELKKALIKVAYTPFQLEAMDKSTIKSTDWKGKIVVLDFWASWCYPCKNSFPGMQMAVDRYADDSDVEFYFIDTMETNEGYKEKAAKYISENKYTFNVLFDAVNPETKAQNVVFSSMNGINKSMAIPRKMILKDGFVRYTSEGYGGSPSKLADEVAYVIKLLKDEK